MALVNTVRRGRWYWNGQILSASDLASGDWNRLEGVFPVTISVAGTFSATVKIYVDTTPNDEAPDDADANHPVLTTLTAPGVYILNGPVEWIKAAVTAHSSGTVTVSVEASDSVTQGGGY